MERLFEDVVRSGGGFILGGDRWCIFWVVVGVSIFTFGACGGWWEIYFGFWWVVVDLFWVAVGGGG